MNTPGKVMRRIRMKGFDELVQLNWFVWGIGPRTWRVRATPTDVARGTPTLF